MATYALTPDQLGELDELHTNRLGIVNKSSATAMSNTARVLIIGLGGVGLETVFRLKKTLIERVGELRESSIQFLAIDTDINDLQKKIDSGILSEHEALHLFNASIGVALKQPVNMIPRSLKSIVPPPEMHWNPELDGNGAGQVRLAGRLGLMDSDAYEKLCTAIRTAIQRLENFVSQKLEIHIVAGIGGGTGSGLCVDVPYIVRKITTSMGVPSANMRMFGHIYLPNVYKGTPGVGLDMAYHNGYAALKEIDYYMNIAEVGEEFRTIYPDGDYACQKNIFDVCTLIGGQIAKAIVTANPRAAAVAACVSSMTNEVTRVVSKNKIADLDANSSMADVFTSSGFRDNANTHLMGVIKSGQANFNMTENFKYSVIGATSLKFPTDAIIEYIIGSCFHKTASFLRTRADTIRQDDIEAFAKGALAPADLMRASLDEFEAQFTAWASGITWNKASVTDGSLDSQLRLIMTNIDSAFDRNGNLVESAWTRLDQRASAIFKDSNKGVFFLARLLTDSPANAGLVGYFEKLESYAGMVSRQIEDTENAIGQNERTKNEMIERVRKAGLFGPARRDLDGVKEALKSIWRDKLKVALLKRLQDSFYLPVSRRIGACYQIRNRLEQKYLTKADILSRLDEILEQSAAIRRGEIFENQDEGSILHLTDEVFEALKGSVQQDVEVRLRNYDDEAAAQFASFMLGNMADRPDDWMVNTDNTKRVSSGFARKFRAFISGYPLFKEITEKGFANYFEDTLAQNPNYTRDSIASKIIAHMETHAAPMFNVVPGFSWGHVANLKHTFMVIPNSMGDGWDQSFQRQLAGQNQNIFLSPDQNAMYNYTMYCNLPLYIHADITEYERMYNSQSCTGEHISESLETAPAYREYPSLIPPVQYYRFATGTLEYENAQETALQKELATLIEKGVAYGVIALSPITGSYEIRKIENRPDDATLNTFFQKYIADPANYEGGMLKGGSALMDRVFKLYGMKTISIAPARLVLPNSLEILPALIRKQMKLFGQLRDEISYIDEKMMGHLESANEAVKERALQRDVAIMMVYGLIDANDKGVWQYHLGENNYRITSRSDVSSGEQPQMTAYMEMVVAGAFYRVCEIIEGQHLVLLKNRIKTINRQIEDDEFDIQILRANSEKYIAKATEIIEKFDVKYQSGVSLNSEEQEIKAFYEAFAANIKALIANFTNG